MNYFKYHALGNDYLVLPPTEVEGELTEKQIQQICHRNFGVGSDGILLGPLPSESCDFKLRILNPDGSEAEKSGNGLRIFVRYLWDQKLVGEEEFRIETLGGNVSCKVLDGGAMVRVEMGRVSFDSRVIPVNGDAREVVDEEIDINGRKDRYTAATVGNPHCVLLRDQVSEAECLELGPQLEVHPLFPNRTNVQFLQVLDRKNIQIEIWERGAGYTLASGSSSSAAAATAVKLGLCDQDITVHMPGGTLTLEFNDDFEAIMTGPVTAVNTGIILPELFSWES